MWVFIPAHGDANWRLCARPSHKKEEKHWLQVAIPELEELQLLHLQEKELMWPLIIIQLRNQMHVK